MDTNDQDVDLNNEAEEVTVESEEQPQKPTETPEAKLARLERQAKQLRKKLGVEDPKPQVLQEKKQSDGLDYGKLAYLEAKGVSGDDAEWALEMAKETGKELPALFATKWFSAELKERKEARIVADATPSASRRSTSSSRDQVEYWLAKGTLPPADQPELRRAYVNARTKKETNSNKFTDHPVGNIR